MNKSTYIGALSISSQFNCIQRPTFHKFLCSNNLAILHTSIFRESLMHYYQPHSQYMHSAEIGACFLPIHGGLFRVAPSIVQCPWCFSRCLPWGAHTLLLWVSVKQCNTPELLVWVERRWVGAQTGLDGCIPVEKKGGREGRREGTIAI